MKFPEEIAYIYIYTPMKAYKAMHASKYLCHYCNPHCFGEHLFKSMKFPEEIAYIYTPMKA